MKKPAGISRGRALAVRALAALLLALLALPAGRGAAQDGATVFAFVGVHVVPMDRERLLENQTVIVRAGRISEIGAAGQVKVPAGATRIDGAGKYLIPGLSEMHAHLPPMAGEPDDAAALQMAVYLANGVTTVRGMIGHASHIALRDRVARGELLGPTLYVAGPPLHAQAVTSPAVAEQMVAEQKKAGFDLVKVHEGLSPETYEAIAAAAKKAGLPIAGHVTFNVGLQRALAARQSCIEHLDNYLQSLVPADAPHRPSPSQVVLGPVLRHIDEGRMGQLAAATREANTYNSMTLALFQLVVSDETPEALLQAPALNYVSPGQRNAFAEQKRGVLGKLGQAPLQDRQRYLELRDRMAKALYQGGARLLVGSDSPQFFLVPGFAAHREMRAMAAAGIPPYGVLEAATRNAAAYAREHLGKPADFGTVEVGKRADVVLLDADPLADIANARRIAGVMVHGRWLPRAELQRMLDHVAATLNPPKQ